MTQIFWNSKNHEIQNIVVSVQANLMQVSFDVNSSEFNGTHSWSASMEDKDCSFNGNTIWALSSQLCFCLGLHFSVNYNLTILIQPQRKHDIEPGRPEEFIFVTSFFNRA